LISRIDYLCWSQKPLSEDLGQTNYLARFRGGERPTTIAEGCRPSHPVSRDMRMHLSPVYKNSSSTRSRLDLRFYSSLLLLAKEPSSRVRTSGQDQPSCGVSPAFVSPEKQGSNRLQLNWIPGGRLATQGRKGRSTYGGKRHEKSGAMGGPHGRTLTSP
jgi:hypothetical protein